MNGPKSRGWETSTSANAAVGTIDSYLSGLSTSDSATHRCAFLHFIQSCIGGDVDAELVNGKVVKGYYHTSTPFKDKDFQLVIKATKRGEIDEPAEIGATQVFECETFVSFVASTTNLKGKSNTGGELQTDGAIQRKDLSHLVDRDLQSASAWLDPSTDTSLELGSGKKWDQFETNSRLFNVKNTYNEDLYTKKLDLSKMTKDQIRKAERMAREIEGSTSENIHLQEERGHLIEREMDEEDMYSGVVRDEGAAWKSNNNSGGFQSQPNSASKKELKGGAGRGAGTPSQYNQQSHQEDGGAWKRAQYKTDGPTSTPTTAGKLPSGKTNVSTPATADGKTMPQPPPPGLVSPSSKGSSNNTGTSETNVGGDIPSTPSGGTAGSASASAAAASEISSSSKPTPSTTTTKDTHDTDKATNKEKDGTGATPSAEEQKPKTTLNPDAKEFKMSASAREFKPTFTIPPVKPAMPMQGQGGHGGPSSGPNNNMSMSGGPGMMPSSPMQQGQQGMGNVNGQGMPRGGYTPPGQAQGMMPANNGQVMVNPNNMQPMNVNMMSAQGGYVNNGQYQPVGMQYNQYGMPMMPMMGGVPQPVMMSYGQGPPVNQANGNGMQPMGGMDVVQSQQQNHLYVQGGDLTSSPPNTGMNNSPGQGSMIVNNQGGGGNPNLPSNVNNNPIIMNNTGGNNNALPLAGSQQQGQGQWPPNVSPGQSGNNIEGGQGQVSEQNQTNNNLPKTMGSHVGQQQQSGGGYPQQMVNTMPMYMNQQLPMQVPGVAGQGYYGPPAMNMIGPNGQPVMMVHPQMAGPGGAQSYPPQMMMAYPGQQMYPGAMMMPPQGQGPVGQYGSPMGIQSPNNNNNNNNNNNLGRNNNQNMQQGNNMGGRDNNSRGGGGRGRGNMQNKPPVGGMSQQGNQGSQGGSGQGMGMSGHGHHPNDPNQPHHNRNNQDGDNNNQSGGSHPRVPAHSPSHSSHGHGLGSHSNPNTMNGSSSSGGYSHPTSGNASVPKSPKSAEKAAAKEKNNNNNSSNNNSSSNNNVDSSSSGGGSGGKEESAPPPAAAATSGSGNTEPMSSTTPAVTSASTTGGEATGSEASSSSPNVPVDGEQKRSSGSAGNSNSGSNPPTSDNASSQQSKSPSPAVPTPAVVVDEKTVPVGESSNKNVSSEDKDKEATK